MANDNTATAQNQGHADDFTSESEFRVVSDDGATAARREARIDPQRDEAPDDPHRIARGILSRYKSAEGRTLAYHQGAFYAWKDGAFRVDPGFRTETLNGLVKAEVDRIYEQQEQARRRKASAAVLAGEKRSPGRPRVVTKVTRTLVGNVGDALATLCRVGDGQSAPFWIERREGDPEPADLIPVSNGLVDISGEVDRLRPHTPRLFSTVARDFPYVPDAPSPALWRGQVLGDQWADDPESIDALHEVFGNCLTSDTRYQKIHVWYGPPRSGRGVMSRVLTALVGGPNVAATSPESFGGPFGLEPLLGKALAIMADARTGINIDSAVAVDRLLRISGCDAVEVNRKNKVGLPGVRLPIRLVIVSNEMPGFRDAAGALAARLHVVRTTRTIPEDERDPDLEDKLTPELPGIFNLALEGLRRLRARKRFLQPASALDLIDDAKDTASPVGTFVGELLDVGPDRSIATMQAFGLWRAWADARGFPPGNLEAFGRALKAAVPGVRKGKPRQDGHRVPTYTGIGLPA